MIGQIRQILKEGEGITVEFKTSRSELNKNTFISVCAFLNRKGGHSLLGVTDSGMVRKLFICTFPKVHKFILQPGRYLTVTATVILI
jgi:ATP-dependent DNA helicase RecG